MAGSYLPPAAGKLSEGELQAVLAAARDDGQSDRRADARHPFFAAVTLRPAKAVDRPITVYARELSTSGIGLLHVVALDVGDVFQLSIQQPGGHDFRKLAEVMWCRPAGDGWYLSGCRFV